MKISSAICAALVSAVIAVGTFGTVAPVKADNVSVNFDQVILMRLAEPAADVIIGNPSIADVTPRSRNLLAITGKAFGSTNMIILDKDNQVLVEHQISVSNGNDKYVAVTRGGQRQSYNCDTFCERTLTIGDTQLNFDALKSQMKDKETLASGGGSNNGPR